jgi:quercetin dioxygenase-like cupin family protein
MSRSAAIIASAALAISSFGVAFAQERLAPYARTERFAGTLTLRRPQSREVNLVIHQWIIRSRQKIAALDLPMKGVVVVQLRGGSLVTIIGGERRKRTEGEFWTVPPGTTMGIETEDDSAIVQTVVVAE